MPKKSFIIGDRAFIDRGGTFTDVVVERSGRTIVEKVRSSEVDLSTLSKVKHVVFGTTVATNCLLEGTGVRTLVLVTEGFEDLPEIRDMTRPDLFDPFVDWPRGLHSRVVGVRGRVGVDGEEIVPLELPTLPDGFEAVAICLLHATRWPEHEAALAAHCRAHGLHTVASHEISAAPGYLPRLQTTVLDAAVTPVLRSAMAKAGIPSHALAMRSDGTLVAVTELRAPDAVLSGPAGGVLATREVARQCGGRMAFGLDMGGTSTDLCRVMVDGPLERATEGLEVAGIRVQRPSLYVHTVGCGGGSVVRHDGVQLRVGPQSAGAEPGPACTGRGGPPTVTDAALLDGRMDAFAFEPALSSALANLPAPAEDVLALAHEQIASALTRLAATLGVSVAEHDLVVLGGAAGQHAVAVAERAGIRRVLVHPCASVLSAWGQSLARIEERVEQAVETTVEDAVAAATARLQGEGELEVRVLVSVADTMGTLSIAHGPDLRERFFAEHERRWGFRPPAEAVLEASLVEARRVQPVRAALPAPIEGFGAVQPEGPFRLDLPTTSVCVPEGWSARVMGDVLVLEAKAVRSHRPTSQALRVALWSRRFSRVAEAAGEVLRRLAQSVNVRERRDFSVAVFTPSGQLVSHAPHIPVHLGAMGATVLDLLEHGFEAGQHYLTNDPAAGGSHLPDLTVVHPVALPEGVFFVASRAHHADVGGTTPGSMPPHSRTLAEEGMVFRRVPLLADGTLRHDLPHLLQSSRQLSALLSDLAAQVAANHHAAGALASLGPCLEPMTEILAAGRAAMAQVLGRFITGPLGARDSLAGVPIELSIDSTAQGWQFRFIAGPHDGNLHAPRAVVRASVLYALRVAAGDELPLNDGTLADVEVHTNPGLLNPPDGAAVAGGNVETSQRIVDLVLSALGVMEPSAGTMSNLTIGGEGWSLYETLGAGGGASATQPGPSARQTHMTNTAATDPEVLETRLPVRLWRFAKRAHSGGAGGQHGGDGLVREIEVLEPCSAALLATRRDRGVGGAKPGVDTLIRGGVERSWGGESTRLEPGDRVRICTPGGAGYSMGG